MLSKWIATYFIVGAIGASLLIGGSTVAQQPRSAGGLPSPAIDSTARGNIDLTKSRVFIFVGKTGLGHDHGVEGRLASGAIKLGAERQAGALVFDMRSFDADTPVARKYVGLKSETDASTRKNVNDNMRGSAVLDVRRFPTARFDIKSAVRFKQLSKRGNPVYQLSGDFTLHGVKRPLRLNAEAFQDKVATQQNDGTPRVHTEAVQQQHQTRLRGGFSVRQSEFGIKPFTKAFGAVGVADELKIYGDIFFVQPAVVAATGSHRNAASGVQR